MWSRLHAAHPAVLAAASHRVERVDLGPGKGVFYRLQVGPHATAAAAGDMCVRLKAQSVDCFIVGPGGAIIARPGPVQANVETTMPAPTERTKPVAVETFQPVERKPPTPGGKAHANQAQATAPP